MTGFRIFSSKIQQIKHVFHPFNLNLVNVFFVCLFFFALNGQLCELLRGSKRCGRETTGNKKKRFKVERQLGRHFDVVNAKCAAISLRTQG